MDEDSETPLRGWRSRWANRSYAASENLSEMQLPSHLGFGAVGPFLEFDGASMGAGYSPSIDPGAETVDVGGMSSHIDDSTALSLIVTNRSCRGWRGKILSWNPFLGIHQRCSH